MTQNVSGIQFVIGGDVSPLLGSFRAAKNELKDTQWVSNLAATVGMAAKTYAMATGAAAAAMVVPFYVAMNATQQYNDNIVRSMALGGDEFVGKWDEISEAVSNYSTNLGVNVNDTSKAIVTLTKAGWKYGEIMNEGMLDTVTKIATANQSSVDIAAETMNAAMHIWEGDIKQTADEIQAAVNASTLDVEDLAYAFQYSGAAAKAAGVDFDSYISMLGALSQIEAQGGESLSTTFLRIFTDDKQALNDIFNSEIVDQAGKINLDMLMAMAGSMSMEQQSEIFDEYSIRVGKNINYFKLVAEEYAEILDGVADSTGILDKAAAEMSASIPALKQRILGAIYAPLLSSDVQESITAALENILATTSSPELAEKIASIFTTFSEFVSKIAPDLINAVERIMDMFIENKAVISNLAQGFIGLVTFISKIPGSLLIAGASFMAFMKILGMLKDTWISAVGKNALPNIFAGIPNGISTGIESFKNFGNPDPLTPTIRQQVYYALQNKYADAKTWVTGENHPYAMFNGPIGAYDKLDYKVGPYSLLKSDLEIQLAQRQTFLDTRKKYDKWSAQYYDGASGTVREPRLVDTLAQRMGYTGEWYAQQNLESEKNSLQQNFLTTQQKFMDKWAGVQEKKWVETYEKNGEMYSSLRSSTALPYGQTMPRTPWNISPYYDAELEATVVGKYNNISNAPKLPKFAEYYDKDLNATVVGAYKNITNKAPSQTALDWANPNLRTTGMRFAGMDEEKLEYLKKYTAEQKANADAIKASTEAQNAAMGETSKSFEDVNAKAMKFAGTMQQALGGIMGVAGGFTMIIASSNPVIQWLGLVTVAVSTLVTMFTLLSAVLTAGSVWMIPVALGVTAGVTAVAAGVLVKTRENQKAADARAANDGKTFIGRQIYEEDEANDDTLPTQRDVPDTVPVNLAAGGIVRARPGGVIARIGEGRHDELVLPLTKGNERAGYTETVYNTNDNRTINNYYPEPPQIWYKTAAKYGV